MPGICAVIEHVCYILHDREREAHLVTVAVLDPEVCPEREDPSDLAGKVVSR